MSALRELAGGIARLFPAGQARLWFVLLAALLLQIAWWQFGAPAAGGPRTPAVALQSTGWAALLLLLCPLAIARLARISLTDLGVRMGDQRFGWSITLFSVPVVLVLAWFAAADPAFQAEYPWPGPSIGGSISLFLTWSALYAVYYAGYEFFYRGLLLCSVEPWWGASGGIWLQTTASVLIHLGKPFPELLAAIPAGIVFGVIAVRSRSLLYPLLIHLILGIATDAFSLLRQGAWP